MTETQREQHRIANRKWAERKRRAAGQKARQPKQLTIRLGHIRSPRQSPEEKRRKQKARYEKYRAELIAYQRAWAKANPDKVRASKALHRRKREAWKRAQGGENVNYRRILERDNWWCGICNNVILGETLQEIHFDHIIPLSKGGLHVESNIQVSHAICNMRKHNSLGP